MKLFTFEDFAISLRNPMTLDSVKRNLITNDEVPFTPKFAVDFKEARLSNELRFKDLSSYGLILGDKVHIAPDRTTVYFVDEQDALMFILAAT